MPSVAELNASIESLYDKWTTDFKPLYDSVTYIKGVMGKRIFGVGKQGGSNVAGTKLPTVPYSTEPLYISVSSLRNAPSKFQVGVYGTRIKSLYFPRGYAQLKKETSAVLPLELTGMLKQGYRKFPPLNNGLDSSIVIDSTELEKIKGLEKAYGKIFFPSPEEQQLMADRLGELMAKEIQKAFDK